MIALNYLPVIPKLGGGNWGLSSSPSLDTNIYVSLHITWFVERDECGPKARFMCLCLSSESLGWTVLFLLPACGTLHGSPLLVPLSQPCPTSPHLTHSLHLLERSSHQKAFVDSSPGLGRSPHHLSYLGNLCLPLGHKDFLLFFSRNFVVLAFILQSLINFCVWCISHIDIQPLKQFDWFFHLYSKLIKIANKIMNFPTLLQCFSSPVY